MCTNLLGDIRVSTQGIFNMMDGTEVYREVLVRGMGKYLGADKIISIVDLKHMDLEFDLTIIKEALTKYNKITSKALTIGINLCKRSLYTDGAAERVVETINKYRGNKIVVIELTENMDFYRKELINNIRELRRNNIVVILDDFGTSRANIDTVLDLNMQMIKIDKKYTDKILNCKDTAIVMRGLAKMFEYTGVKVIVEGVETEEQLDTLIHIGYENFQGYFLEKPIELIDKTEALKCN